MAPIQQHILKGEKSDWHAHIRINFAFTYITNRYNTQGWFTVAIEVVELALRLGWDSFFEVKRHLIPMGIILHEISRGSCIQYVPKISERRLPQQEHILPGPRFGLG
jgi:hypothetical protein